MKSRIRLVLTTPLCLALFWASGAAEQPPAPPASQDYRLGQTIVLDKGMKLTVTAQEWQGGSVEVDRLGGRMGRSIERGLEINLTFENTGNEPMESALLMQKTPEGSEVTLADAEGKATAPIAMKLEGNALGYRTPDAPGGYAIGDCQDNPPVSVRDQSGNFTGLICLFCTKPGEKDTLVVMFPKPAKPGESQIKIKCKLCGEGVIVRADFSKQM